MQELAIFLEVGLPVVLFISFIVVKTRGVYLPLGEK